MSETSEKEVLGRGISTKGLLERNERERDGMTSRGQAYDKPYQILSLPRLNIDLRVNRRKQRKR